MLLHEFLTRSADKNPHQIAIIYQNVRLHYSKLDQLSSILSIRFLNNGMSPGDRVAVLLDNSDKYIITYFGILKAGGVVVPMNTHLVNREIAVIVNDCTPRFV